MTSPVGGAAPRWGASPSSATVYCSYVSDNFRTVCRALCGVETGGAAQGTAPTFAATPPTVVASARMAPFVARQHAAKLFHTCHVERCQERTKGLERSRQRSRPNAKYQHKEGSRPSLREDSRATLSRGVYKSIPVLTENHPAPCRVSLMSKYSLQQPLAQWALHETERQVKIQLWAGPQNLRVLTQQPT